MSEMIRFDYYYGQEAEPGVYYVKETKAPKGYNIPENPLKKITI